MRQEGDDLSLLRIGSQKRQSRPSGGDYELLLGAGELAQNRLDDIGWRLDRQRVEEHVRGSRHGHDWTQSSLRGFQDSKVRGCQWRVAVVATGC